MRTEEKIWLIEAGDVLEVMNPAPETSVTKKKAAPSKPKPARLHTAAAPSRDEARIVPPPPPRNTMHFALLVPLTYLLGPLSLLLTRTGRRDRMWVGTSLASAAATAVLLAVPFDRFFSAAGLAAPLLWCGLAIFAAVGTFTVWSRALLIAGRDLGPAQVRLPRWLRRKWMLTAFGLLAPGSGLLLAGRRQAAALVLWLLWPAALGALVLVNGRSIWQSLPRALPDPRFLITAETVFLIAAGTILVGALIWLVQALEVARQKGSVSYRRSHTKQYALALGVACAVLFLTMDRTHIAGQLGSRAQVLRSADMKVIPLYLNLAADRLDSSQAKYAAQAMALYADLGRVEEADELRQRLDRGLQTYLAALPSQTSLANASPTSHEPGLDGRSGARSNDPGSNQDADLYYGFMGAPNLGSRLDDERPLQPAQQQP